MPDDLALLQRYARRRDAEAFTALVQRHAGLVYATCLRITQSAQDAEDLAQECFWHLARHAQSVKTSVPGYLHALATSRALNARRNAATRRHHEEQAMGTSPASANPPEPSWQDLAPHVDTAIAALPEELRVPLVLHYLQGRTQTDIAAELAVNQATVSRRLAAAIEELRARLSGEGIGLAITPALLGTLLSQHAAIPAPAALLITLTKMALAGPSTAATTTTLLAAKGKLLAILAATFLIAGTILTVAIMPRPHKESSMSPTPPVAVRREGNRVWIDGVPRLQWGQSGDNTFTGALHASLVGMGEKHFYEQLMVCSGLAFRLRWGRAVDGRSWNGSAPIGELSDVDYTPATGWSLRWDGGLNQHRAQGLQQIVASIDAGKPVLGYVNPGEWDMGLVYGYEDHGQRLLIQDYYFKDQEPNIVPATDVHDLVAFFSQKADPVAPHDALLQGLQKAIAFWNMGTIDVQQIKTWETKGKGLFYYGPHAYRQWREDLTAAEQLPKDLLPSLRHHNMWIGCSLTDGRKAAAQTLPQLAGLLRQESARKELQAAADLYAQLAELSKQRLVPSLVNEDAKFTPELRKTVIAVLGDIERLDTQAMDHLARAVEIEQGSVSSRPSALALSGDGMVQDSFSLALVAAAQRLGRPADYETVYALSTNAFSPALEHTGQDCKDWWHVQAWLGDKALPTLTARLGLTARKLDPDPFDGDSPAWCRAVAPGIRSALAAGNAVLVEGGFDNPAPWPWAGLVTDVRADGTIYGAALNGRLDNPLKHPYGIHSIASGTPTLSAHDADQLTLRSAVARIRGLPPFQRTDRAVYGRAAMDEWIRVMSTTPGFCEVCQTTKKQGWRCATDNARTTAAASLAAAAYLRRIAPDFPTAARPHLLAAAAQYQRINQLLRPAIADPADDPPTAALHGRTYQFQLVTPKQLAAMQLITRGKTPYDNELSVLYNIHCELADEPTDALNRRLAARGISYSQYWGQLAAALPDQPFALIAQEGGKLAGYLRFYPADRGKLREGLAARQLGAANNLIIGAGAVDLAGLDDGLDDELLGRVVRCAISENYASIQAVGWANIRAMAAWGQQYRRSIYESHGFALVATAPTDATALQDQLTGAHGAAVQQLARTDVPEGADLTALAQVGLMQLDFTAGVGRAVRLGSYQQIVGNLDRQKAYAQSVLKDVQAALTATGDELQQALAAIPPVEKLSLTPTLTMDFVLIPPGTFTMGSPDSEPHRGKDETQHPVTLTRPFYLATTHVTRAQFAVFVQDTGYQTDAEKQGWAYGLTGGNWGKVNGATWSKPGFEQTDSHPVVCVSYQDAHAFCQWLSKKTARPVRLPTEAEWEYACRAGATTTFPWGNDPKDAEGWLNAEDKEGHADGVRFTSPVASFKRNAFGLYDMLGNACQPTADFLAPYPGTPQTDPKGPASGSQHAARGGSWDYPPAYCRPAWRNPLDPDTRSWDTSFRIAMDAAPATTIPLAISDRTPPAEDPNEGNAHQVADVTLQSQADPTGNYVLVTLANRPKTPAWSAAKVLIDQYSSSVLPESISLEIHNPGVPIRIVADATDAYGQFEIDFCPNDTTWTGWKTFTATLTSHQPDRFKKAPGPLTAPLRLDYLLIIQRQGKPYQIGLRRLELHLPTAVLSVPPAK